MGVLTETVTPQELEWMIRWGRDGGPEPDKLMPVAKGTKPQKYRKAAWLIGKAMREIGDEVETLFPKKGLADILAEKE